MGFLKALGKIAQSAGKTMNNMSSSNVVRTRRTDEEFGSLLGWTSDEVW